MIMKKKLLFLICLFCSITFILHAQGVISKGNKLNLIAEIDSLLQTQVDDDKIPGAVIQIKKGDKIIYNKSYGYAEKYDFNHQLLHPPETMTSHHLFDIASLTKVTGTTTAIMLLTDQGRVHIDDPVSKYIKAFLAPDKSKITLRHLLTHTAGLYEWYPLYYKASDKEACYKLIEALPLKFPVGAGRHYSDLGFVLLGHIVELVSGMTLETFVKQNIFIPLGMHNTMYNPRTKGITKDIATTSPGNPYEKRMVYDSTLGFQVKEIEPTSWNGWRRYNLKGEVNDGNAWYANGGVSGAAGLFSTAEDLQKLVDMLMSKGKIKSGQFISTKTVEKFLTKDQFKNGLGWMMDPESSFMKNAPVGSYGHTGFTGTSITVVPSYHASVILLINRQNTGLLKDGQYYNVSPLRMKVFNAVLKYCK
jgi:serine-type D-Ala-D-Ala carboxypeptidase